MTAAQSPGTAGLVAQDSESGPEPRRQGLAGTCCLEAARVWRGAATVWSPSRSARAALTAQSRVLLSGVSQTALRPLTNKYNCD